MKNKTLNSGLLVILILAAILAWVMYDHTRSTDSDKKVTTTTAPTTSPSPTDDNSSEVIISQKEVKLSVETPKKGEKVTSPIAISGKVPGNWSSEGTFTIDLIASDGTVLATDQAKLVGDWMTEANVPFTASLSFTEQPTGNAGTIRLHKTNPSGSPANDDMAGFGVLF